VDGGDCSKSNAKSGLVPVCNGLQHYCQNSVEKQMLLVLQTHLCNNTKYTESSCIDMSLPLNENTHPKTHTYPNWGHGYSKNDDFPPPFLTNAESPTVPAGTPDLAGTWKVTEVFGRVTGRKVEDEERDSHKNHEEHTAGWYLEFPHVGFVQRIEQAGNRVIITTAAPHKVIHDMRCDGSIENGMDDVSGIDHMTHIQATAEYIHDKKRGSVHVMRPVTPHLSKISRILTVERWREGDKLIWKYGFYTIHLVRVTEADSANSATLASAAQHESNIPKAHTYPNWGYGYSQTNEFPPLSLGKNNIPRSPEAPDIAGMWKIVEVVQRVTNRKVDADDPGWPMKHPPLDLLQRIEQAGDRVVITTGGATPPHRIIHDMVCNGSIAGCADDVNGKDQVTRIRATGHFIEDDRGRVHVLCPTFTHVDKPIPGVEVERWREGDRLVWKYGLYRMYCERVTETAASLGRGGEVEEEEGTEGTEVDAFVPEKEGEEDSVHENKKPKLR
jgi:hypothetical protein